MTLGLEDNKKTLEWSDEKKLTFTSFTMTGFGFYEYIFSISAHAKRQIQAAALDALADANKEQVTRLNAIEQ